MSVDKADLSGFENPFSPPPSYVPSQHQNRKKYFEQHVERKISESTNSFDSSSTSDNGGISWFWIDIANGSNREISKLLELQDAIAAGWYYKDAQNRLHYGVYSSDNFFSNHVVFDGNVVIPIYLRPQESRRIYVSVYTFSSQKNIKPILWDSESFRRDRMIFHMLDGAYFGLMLGLILYNFSLFFSFRASIYVYYAIFQSMICIEIFFASRYAELFIISNYPGYSLSINVLLLGFIAVFFNLFSLKLLRLKIFNNTLLLLWRLSTVIVAVQAIVHSSLALPQFYNHKIFSEAIIVGLIFDLIMFAIPVVTLVQLWEKFTIVRWWFAALSLHILSILTWIYFVIAGADIDFDPRYIAQGSTIIDAIILLTLLVKSVKDERIQRARAQIELVNSNNKIEKIKASKESLISAISHELQQPLRALSLHTANLSLHSTEKTYPLLQKIDSDTKELLNIIMGMLEYSKSNRIMKKVRINKFSTKIMLDKLYAEFYPVAEQRQLKLTFPENDVIIHSDEVLLRQIIRNLLSNAIKYTKWGGVDVCAREQEGNVVIEVTDTGCGINADELEMIFDEFYRGNSAHKLDEGLGLGLSIVNRLALALEIDIAVSSVDGGGTTFSLTLTKALSSPSHKLMQHQDKQCQDRHPSGF